MQQNISHNKAMHGGFFMLRLRLHCKAKPTGGGMIQSMKPEDLTPEDIQNIGQLDSYQAYMQGEFDRARDQEAEARNQLDKSLWLSNGGAATVTISNLVVNGDSFLLFLGASAFVAGVACLLIMRISHAYNSTRDRIRRQEYSERLFTENLNISTLESIRDSWYLFHGNLCRGLNTLAALLFIVGCGLSLWGVNPGS